MISFFKKRVLSIYIEKNLEEYTQISGDCFIFSFPLIFSKVYMSCFCCKPLKKNPLTSSYCLRRKSKHPSTA